MFEFSGGASITMTILVWLGLMIGLILLNELARRYKTAGFAMFFVAPAILMVLWLTVFRDTFPGGWFSHIKTYTLIICCIGGWFIRYYNETDKVTGKQLNVFDTKFAKFAIIFPPTLLAINIIQAVVRDFQVGATYAGMSPTFSYVSGAYVLAGSWNYMNAIAGIFNILAITGFVGITLKKETAKDKSRSVLWPDMLWFYIIPYTLWNFAYFYNSIPHRAWFAMAVLLAPLIIDFVAGKGSWIQHRVFTLMFWVFLTRTAPQFTDSSIFRVDTSYNPTVMFIVSFLSLAANTALLCYTIGKWKRTGRNPYTGELHTDLKGYKEVKAMSIVD